MRVVLVFTPLANPTYVPVGITTLCEYIRVHVPDCTIRAVDLNLTLWQAAAGASEAGRALRAFMQGRDGDFYERGRYDEHMATWSQLAREQEQFIQHAKVYLEQDRLEDGFEAVLGHCGQHVLADGPELVGFSVMYPRQLLFSLALAKYLDGILKGSGGRPRMILGGAAISALREEEILRACPFVDGVFNGEGELGLQRLCEGEPFERIGGLSWRNGESIVRNRKPDTVPMAKIPQPRFEGIDLGAYFTPRPVVPVIYSRGCKWRKCRFCAHNFSYSGYRKRDNAAFVDYLVELGETSGVRDFYFADQYVDAEDMLLLSQEILRRGVAVNFHIMGRPTDSYTPELLRTLSQAGCRWISWGVETGSQRLLDVCGKGTEVETIRRVLADAHAAGISNLLMMIFGLPTSGDEDMRATLDFLDELSPFVDDVTCSSFQLWEKTGFANQAERYGLKIVERERLAACPGGAIHSLRLAFKEKGLDGSYRPGRGADEAGQWQRRKKRAGWHSVYEGLCCEHYLLYAVHLHREDNKTPQLL
jgi:radical SAM superfamily enzyme YgiQ (UPF0313 family)